MVAAPATMAQRAIQKDPEGFNLYSRFALAGALGCSVTHGAFTPVDVYESITSSSTPITNTPPIVSRPESSSTPLPTTVV